jgi:UDP-N-acetylglucosamine 3-dehydrogenase
MNIGILGTGFGAYHAGLWRKIEHVERIVIFGRNEDKLRELRNQYDVEVTSNIDDVLLDPTLELIDICLPSALHREYAILALKNGKHVFCETPVCLNWEDVLAMQQAEQKYNRRVLVNQFIKFDPPYTYLHDVIQQQKYGPLLSLTLKRETAPLWGDLGLGSIATNLMIHELDFINWVWGSLNPTTVWGSDSGKKEQALVRVSMHQPEGFAEIIASSQMPDRYPFTVGYEAYFANGKLEYHESDDGSGQAESALYEFNAQGKHRIDLQKSDPYEKSIEHVAHALHYNKDSRLSLGQAAESMYIALEVQQKLAGIS